MPRQCQSREGKTAEHCQAAVIERSLRETRRPYEIRAMAEDLDISPYDFTQKHTQIRASRNGLTLKQDEKGSCVLLENNSCSVHSSKPQQCKDFPNKWRFKGWRQICEATPKEISE